MNKNFNYVSHFNNKTRKINRNIPTGTSIPLGNLLKQIGEAINQNQNSQNIINLINKISNKPKPNNTTNKILKK